MPIKFAFPRANKMRCGPDVFPTQFFEDWCRGSNSFPAALVFATRIHRDHRTAVRINQTTSPMHVGWRTDGSFCRALWADHGRHGIAKRLPSGSRLRCRIASTPTTVATPMFPTIAATAGIELMCRSPTHSRTAALCCTLRAPDRPQLSTSGTNSPASTRVATTSSSSISHPCYRSQHRATCRQASPENKTKKPDGVPISILCDNSRDLDRMPSDLSDFSLYGGMYRHVNLVYVPAISLETAHVRTELPSPKGPAMVAILGTLYNPVGTSDSFEVSVEITDAKGTSIHRSKQMLKPWQDAMEITSFTVATPQLWSPANPHLYQCRITLHGGTESELHSARELRHPPHRVCRTWALQTEWRASAAARDASPRRPCRLCSGDAGRADRSGDAAYQGHGR